MSPSRVVLYTILPSYHVHFLGGRSIPAQHTNGGHRATRYIPKERLADVCERFANTYTLGEAAIQEKEEEEGREKLAEATIDIS